MMPRREFPKAVKVAVIKRSTREHVVYCEACGSNECWSDIPSVDHYQASCRGRIRSIDRIGMQTRKHGPVCRILSGKVLSPTDNGHGYLSVQLGSNVRRYVHRLVCEAFHGPAPKNHQVAHRDGNRKNNAPNNLRWATVKENMNDKLLHGTLVYGETQHNSKLKEKDVLKIRSSSAGLLSLAREYGVTTDTIWKAKTGQSWKQVIGHDG